MAAATIGGVSVPFGGGGYFRLYPYWLTRQLIDRANRRGWPVVFYVHPWELDSDQPRQSVGAVTRFRHYNNIGRVKGRLQRLLSDFTFVPLGERIEDA